MRLGRVDEVRGELAVAATFLDMGRPYPNEAFTAVISGSDRAKFGAPETTLSGKRICVTGQVRDHRGKLGIIVSDPSLLSQ